MSGPLRRAWSQAALPTARLFYAGMTGAALMLVVANGDTVDAAGAYVYQVGFAGAAATLLSLGLDRIVARRLAAGELTSHYPVSLLRYRLGLAGAVLLIAALSAFVTGRIALASSTAFFVVARLFYADIEAFWIAMRNSNRRLGLALAVNALVTAVGIAGGAYLGSAAMTAFSACGNLIGLIVLLGSGQVGLRNQALPKLAAETSGMAPSIGLSILYSRVDLVILALVQMPLDAVAVYGVASRIFEAVGVVRGSLVQQEARELAPLSVAQRVFPLRTLACRVAVTVTVIAGAGLVALHLLRLQNTVQIGTDLFGVATVGILTLPLYVSHMVTSAMIFSDHRTKLLLKGSVVASVVSVALKAILITGLGLYGAVFALGLVEYASCAVFFFLYWPSPYYSAGAAVPLAPVAVALSLGTALAGVSLMTAVAGW